MHGTAGRHDRSLANRLQDLARGDADGAFRAAAQHDAETVAADAADDVGGTQAGFDALPDTDDHGIGRGRAEGLFDTGQFVDADDEIGAGNAIARGQSQAVLQRLFQTSFVVVAGEVIEAGKIFKPRFPLLAGGDDAQGTKHAHRAAVLELRRAAITEPNDLALIGAQSVFAVEFLIMGRVEMRLQLLRALGLVVGHDTGTEIGAGEGRFLPAEESGKAAGPGDLIGQQIPVIRRVAGGGDGLRRRDSGAQPGVICLLIVHSDRAVPLGAYPTAGRRTDGRAPTWTGTLTNLA